MKWNNPKFKKQSIVEERHARIAIDHVTIFDGTGTDSYEDGRIVIQDGKLVAVGKREEVDIPADSHVIDGKGMTALPGLIDAHVHLSWNGVFEPYPIFFGESLPDRLSRNARITLHSGVTTVREMPGFGGIKLRDSINNGEIPGPRLLVSTTALTVKGGYFNYPMWGTAVTDTLKLSNIIQKKVESGCDFIKTVAPYSDALKQQKNISSKTMSGIVQESKKLGLKVAAHSMWPEGLETAVDAGVTSIEHCPSYVGGVMSDEILIKIRDKGIYLVPTIDLVRRNSELFQDGDSLLEEKEYSENMPKKSFAKMIKMLERVKKVMGKKPHIKDAFDSLINGYEKDYSTNFQKAIKFGVKIAAGTDSGSNYVPHGILPRELELYVKFGMTPKQAILTATKVGAELLGLEKEIGTLEVGKRGELILVKGNPLTNITDLQNVQYVIKDGIIVRT